GRGARAPVRTRNGAAKLYDSDHGAKSEKPLIRDEGCVRECWTTQPDAGGIRNAVCFPRADSNGHGDVWAVVVVGLSFAADDPCMLGASIQRVIVWGLCEERPRGRRGQPVPQ